MAFVGIRFEFGQAVLCEYDADGVLKAQPDGIGQTPQLASYDVTHPLGFAARAPAAKAGPKGKPLGGGGCTLLIGKDGSEYKVELKGDYRDLAGIPPLPKEGGSVQYAPGCPTPSFHVVSSKDGTHQIYVEVGDSSHVITVGLDGNGEPVLSLTHRDGMAIEMFRKSLRLKNAGGDAFLELNMVGMTISANTKLVGDISNESGISLLTHVHLSPLGPTGPPIPGGP